MGHKFWTGYNPNTNSLDAHSGVDGDILSKGYTGQAFSTGQNSIDMNPRVGALFYFHSTGTVSKPKNEQKFIAQNIDMYLAGNVGGAGIVGDIGVVNGKITTPHKGVLGIHTVWNGKLSNVSAHLYGKAAFLSLETWWAGKMEFDDTSGKEVKVNIEGVSDSGQENTIFFI